MPAPDTARARPARFDAGSQQRRAMIAKVHVARKQLAIMEDDYRQGLFERTGKTSLTECTDREIATVLEWLKTKGFRPLPRPGVARHPMAQKARALWISLYHLGVVHNASEHALEAFAKRQLGCERLVWARQSDAYKLIEALKSMAVRAGWLQHCRVTGKPLSPAGLQSSLCHVILGRLKEAGIAPDGWGLHDAMWLLCGIENARETAWTAEDYDQLARALGDKLRKHGNAEGALTKGDTA